MFAPSFYECYYFYDVVQFVGGAFGLPSFINLDEGLFVEGFEGTWPYIICYSKFIMSAEVFYI